MNESTILTSIKKSNNSSKIFGTILLVVSLVLSVLLFKTVLAYILGPATVDAAELATFKAPSDAPRPWVKVDGLGLYDSGYKMYESKDGGPEYVTDSYSAMDLGNDKIILVKQAGDLSNKISEDITVTGELVAFDADERTGIYEDLLASNPGLEEYLVPMVLNTDDFRGSYWWLLPFLLVLGVAGLILLFKGLTRSGDITKHPIYKSLSRHGENVESTISQIEAEMAQPHTTIGKILHLTRNWLVESHGGTFEAMKYEDLAWVYRHVQTTRSYGIPVSRTHSLFIFDKYKKKMQTIFGRKERDALDALEAIFQEAPWAIYGYANETQKRWNKENDVFLAEVEDRRRQVRQGHEMQPLDTNYQEDEVQDQ